MNFRRASTLVSYPILRYATCAFAVTNRCNAQCRFCAISKQPHGEVIPAEQAERALDQLYKLGVRDVQLSGGEPLLYPHLIRIVQYASNLGMLPTIATNGSLLDEGNVRVLVESGAQGFSISVDHHDRDVFERNRGLPGLADQIARVVQCLRASGVVPRASTTISRLLDVDAGDYVALLEHNQRLGFGGTYLSYPMTNMRSNHKMGGEIVNYEKGELVKIVVHIQALKRQGYPVDNSWEMLDVALAFLNGEPSRYPCVAGRKFFYLDWHLNLYDCMAKGTPIGPILSLDTTHLDIPWSECEQCIHSCAREASIMHHGWQSTKPWLRVIGDSWRWK